MSSVNQGMSSNGSRHLTPATPVSSNVYYESSPSVSSRASIEYCSQNYGSPSIAAHRHSLVEDRYGAAVYPGPSISQRPSATSSQ